MDNEKSDFCNPNNVIRKYIVALYDESLKNAACSVDSVENYFKNCMDIIKGKDSSLYEKMIEIMYTDYVVSRVLLKCEEKNDFVLVEDKPQLIYLVSKDKYLLSNMASATRQRNIDITHIYSSMYKLNYAELKVLLNVSKCIVYDYVENRYPFVIKRSHENLETNTFTKESSNKSIALVELLNEMKSFEKEDYQKTIQYYLEIYYMFKKYCIEFLDTVLSYKERILIKLLDESNINGAITLVSRDDDLLELVLNEYSNHYFDKNDELKQEVETYYLKLEKKQKLDNIFRKKEKSNEQ